VPFLSENCWARDRKESGKRNSEFCPTSGHLFAFHPLYLSSFQKVFFSVFIWGFSRRTQQMTDDCNLKKNIHLAKIQLNWIKRNLSAWRFLSYSK
jgi:hypothetical protein